MLPVAAATALVLAGAGVALATRDHWAGGSGPTASTTATGAARESDPVRPSPSPTAVLPAAVGIVRIDPAVTGPRAVEIATLFDTYFSGINDRDYARALSAYDPAGVIDPADPAQAANFRRGVRTTTDSDIVLRSVAADPTGRGAVEAYLTFRSNQEPGMGPRERPLETCTRWDVRYTLSEPAGQYLILASRATHAPC